MGAVKKMKWRGKKNAFYSKPTWTEVNNSGIKDLQCLYYVYKKKEKHFSSVSFAIYPPLQLYKNENIDKI